MGTSNFCRLPKKNATVAQKWLDHIGLKPENLPKSIFGCSNHFTSDDYDYPGSPLKSDSVPNKNLEYEKSASFWLLCNAQETFTIKKCCKSKSSEKEAETFDGICWCVKCGAFYHSNVVYLQ